MHRGDLGCGLAGSQVTPLSTQQAQSEEEPRSPHPAPAQSHAPGGEDQAIRTTFFEEQRNGVTSGPGSLVCHQPEGMGAIPIQ